MLDFLIKVSHSTTSYQHKRYTREVLVEEQEGAQEENG
jgi:hypothetical protein